jgi:4-amino-4-deoxy-L-arabinose transferase-like glycosyltransferase
MLEAPTATPRARPREALVPLALFTAARVVNWAAAWVASYVAGGDRTLGDVLAKWDGDWYVHIVRVGYPETVPVNQGSALAFFPGYPLLARAVQAVTPFGPRTSAILVNVLCAAAATVLFNHFARVITDSDSALRATALFAFFPGTFVFGMAYSEGLFILAAIACLLCLHTGRWPLAGLACAVAAATRPTGLIVIGCCAFAAATAIVRRRDLRALTAPVIGVLGFAAWALYLQRHTGNALAWNDARQEGWDQGIDFGRFTLERAETVLNHPLDDVNALASMVMVLVVLICTGLWIAGRWRAPAIVVLYTAGIVLSGLLSDGVDLTARYVLTAFPLLIAAGRILRGAALQAAVGIGAGGMAVFMILAGATSGYTP